METLAPASSPPVFVMRGAPRGAGRLAFLHGMCGHGLGYAQAFQFSAARRGTLIAWRRGPALAGSADVTNLEELIGMITDRDICMATWSQARAPNAVFVAEAMPRARPGAGL